ncbi:MAG: polysaccharide deacetylase family protein [Nitrospirae bacterium]|nr:MAG: polysaccharide deacetylase family protein [Nitrospirota bacterium]
MGSHFVSHADLRQCDDRTVAEELTQSKKDIEAMLNRPVTVFSCPFGGKHNVDGGIDDLLRQSGYQAMFANRPVQYHAYRRYRADSATRLDPGDRRSFAWSLRASVEDQTAGR